MADTDVGNGAEAEMKEEVAAENGNGNGVDKEDSTEVDKSLEGKALKASVLEAMKKLFESGHLLAEDVDDRAYEMLNSFPEDQGKYVIDQLRESELFGVQNKSQYLMSLMRNFRDRIRQQGAASVLSSKLITGPDRAKMEQLLKERGYPLEITVGQRKYGGPPPDWEGPATGPTAQGHEIYIGHIPHDLFEDSLIPLFETTGKIWDLRLMMDPMTGKNRGYAFLTYCEKSSASEAAKKYDGHEIVPGKSLKVNVSVANTRLFLGNIPKSKTKDEILEEIKKHAEGVADVIVYAIPDATDRHKNRGFCFVDFVDHKTASDAKRRIQQHKIRPFTTDLVVDWAEQQDEPDDEVMAKVKVLYVRNLKESVTEDKLKEIFSPYGEIERVKKVKDYAFVHYKEREPCIKAMEEWNGKEIEGVAVDCSLAKPQSDKKKKPQPQPNRGGGMRGGRGGPSQSPWGGRGRGAQSGGGYYPNAGYDDYAAYGAGYGNGYGAGYGMGYGDYDYSYGAYGGGGGGYGAPMHGGWGAGWGAPAGGQGGGRMGGGRGAGGSNRSRGFKRRGDRSGGPASKRDNGGGDFSSDVNMSSF